jgi:DNA repair protein RadC
MEQLSKVKGVGQSAAAYLVCIGKFYEKYYDPNTTVFPDRFDKETFIPFVKEKYAPLKEEVLDIYLLSSVGKITHCRRFTIEQEDQVEILPTDFTKLISEYKPSGMVIVHNHPKGSCLPSKADDETTKKIQLICSFHNVLLCDHFIYSPTGVYSYYETGKMQEITQNCSLFNVLSGIRE